MNGLSKILLIEDSRNDIELTLMALDEHTLANEVVVARDGEEGLDYLYRRGAYRSLDLPAPALVLLDLKLPKVDGLEVLEKIKSHPELRTIPVVMLTSSREEQDVLKSYGLGANAYVVKPVTFDDFIEAVGEVGLFWAVLNEPPLGSVGGLC